MPNWNDRIVSAGRLTTAIAFLLLLAAFVLWLRVPFEGTARVGEGESFRGQPSQYDTLRYDEAGGFPDVSFVVADLRALQDPVGDLVGIEAAVRVPDADGDAVVLSDAAPLTIGDVSVRPYRINVAPVFRVRVPGQEQDATIAPKLTLWRPDRPTDSFPLPDGSATAVLRFFPDHFIGPEGHSSRSMTWRNPAIEVRLVSNGPGGPSGQALLKPGESHAFGSVQLELVELRRWCAVELREHRSHRLAYLGGGAFLLGLLVQLAAWLRRRTHADATREES